VNYRSVSESAASVASASIRQLAQRVWASVQRHIVIAASALFVLASASAAAGYLFWQMTGEASRAAAAFTLDSGAQATMIYDAHDRVVFTLFTEQRTDVPLNRVSPHLIAAVLAAEDRRFFAHRGLDFRRVISATLANVRAGRIVEGGSTITQQLVRMTNGDRSRTFDRKLREILTAMAIERRFPKDAILQTYLNKVYLGEGFYGVEAASRGYFGKPAADVTAEEAATIAALIQSPVKYTQDTYASRVRARRNWILAAMREQHLLEASACREAIAAPLRLSVVMATAPMPGAVDAKTEKTDKADKVDKTGLYFKEAVRQQLITLLPSSQVLSGGLRVYTTVDMSMQAAAEQAVRERLRALERGARDEGASPLQGSLVALDPQTGYVKALVGGRSFVESPFDRARQARRQPGSAFKPFVFASAIELGYEPGTLLRDLDLPINAGTGTQEPWQTPYLPRDTHEARDMTMREALVVSSNRAAVHLIQQIGLSSVLTFAQRVGINSRLPAVPSLALGSGEVTLLEMTSAYGVFANQGVRAEPILIRRVESASGDVLFRADPAAHRVVNEDTAFLVTSMLTDVITRGTGSEVRRQGFTLPAAGKTGTTNGFADAWFIGFTPRLAAGVWIGRDDPHEIRKRGFAATVAAPAWATFMKAATQGQRAEPFTQPAGIERVAYCHMSDDRPGIYYDLARASATPAAPCDTNATVAGGTGTITIGDGGTFRTIRLTPTGLAGTASSRPPLLTPGEAIEIWRGR